MVDTGASIVALTKEDALKLGYDYRTMNKDLKITTASGVVYGASVTLDRLEIESVMIKRVRAVVLDQGLEQSLLGNSFLNMLSRRETNENVMILHQ